MDMTYFLTKMNYYLNKKLYMAVNLPHVHHKSFVLKANAMAAVP